MHEMKFNYSATISRLMRQSRATLNTTACRCWGVDIAIRADIVNCLNYVNQDSPSSCRVSPVSVLGKSPKQISAVLGK